MKLPDGAAERRPAPERRVRLDPAAAATPAEHGERDLAAAEGAPLGTGPRVRRRSPHT